MMDGDGDRKKVVFKPFKDG